MVYGQRLSAGQEMKKNSRHSGYFRERVALVTGSSRGIGKATALLLALRGAKVIVNGRNIEKLEEARSEIEAAGGTVLAVPGDVTAPETCRQIVERAIDAFGRLDVLINNAGISMRGRFEEVNPRVMKQVVDLNLLGTAYMTRFALPGMQGKANRKRCLVQVGFDEPLFRRSVLRHPGIIQ